MLQIAFKFFQLNLLKKYNQSNELKQKKRKKGKQNKNEIKINTMEKCKRKCKKQILK